MRFEAVSWKKDRMRGKEMAKSPVQVHVTMRNEGRIHDESGEKRGRSSRSVRKGGVKKRIFSLMSRCMCFPPVKEKEKSGKQHVQQELQPHPMQQELKRRQMQQAQVQPKRQDTSTLEKALDAPITPRDNSDNLSEEAPTCPSSLASTEPATEYFSASSILEQIPSYLEPAQKDRIAVRDLNAQAPKAVPSNSILASLDAVEVVPDICGLAGLWVKVLGKTTPNFGPVDKILKAGFFVEQVRHKIIKCDIKETREQFTIEALMPILGLPRFIETFKKDGSIIELNARRDSRKGKAYGQALALSDGKIVTRVWNLGASPELFFEDVYAPGNGGFTLEQNTFGLGTGESAYLKSFMVPRDP